MRWSRPSGPSRGYLLRLLLSSGQVRGWRYAERAINVSDRGSRTYLFVAGIMDGGLQFLGSLALIVNHSAAPV